MIDFPLHSRINLDEYMLTMGQAMSLPIAQEHLLGGMHEENTTFELFVRSLPGKDAPDPRTARTYLIASGIEAAIDYLEHVRFTDDHLRELLACGYDPGFVDYLRHWHFRGSVDAVPEGTVITAQVPILSVSGPRIDCQLVESALLGLIGPNTLFTTKAARIVQAAQGRNLSDFSLRRLQHPAIADTVVRSSYIAGFDSSASWEAARQAGVPATGTMAHHFIMRFGPEGEQEAFEQFLRAWPGRAVLLVDTYDTLRGIERAIAASRATGIALKAVRLDSGDLLTLSKDGRRVLDDAGFTDTQIIATNDLHEIAIADLLAEGAPIDGFGVGTMLGTSADCPALGIVYKLTEQTIAGERTQRMKLAAGKQTDPGRHTTWRRSDGQLVLALADEDLSGEATRLTERMMTVGHRATWRRDIEEVRERIAQELAAMPKRHRFGHGAEEMTLERTQGLWRLRADLGDEQAAEHLV